MQDAVVLARTLSTQPSTSSLEEALREYERQRSERCFPLTARSNLMVSTNIPTARAMSYSSSQACILNHMQKKHQADAIHAQTQVLKPSCIVTGCGAAASLWPCFTRSRRICEHGLLAQPLPGSHYIWRGPLGWELSCELFDLLLFDLNPENVWTSVQWMASCWNVCVS